MLQIVVPVCFFLCQLDIIILIVLYALCLYGFSLCLFFFRRDFPEVGDGIDLKGDPYMDLMVFRWL